MRAELNSKDFLVAQLDVIAAELTKLRSATTARRRDEQDDVRRRGSAALPGRRQDVEDEGPISGARVPMGLDAEDDRRAAERDMPAEDLSAASASLEALRVRLADGSLDGDLVKPRATTATDDEDGRRDGTATGARRLGDIDDEQAMIFVPDDPILALVQSSLDAYFDRDLEGRTVEAVDLSTDLGDNRRGGSAVDPILYDEGLRPDSPDKRRLFGKFEMTDPGWIASFFALQLRRFTDKHPFNPSPADSVMLADRTRIVLVGDWGSGVPRARQVATHMRRHIDDAIGDGVAVHVVHLGDVYYSGLPREYEKRFLAHWPVRMDEADAIGSWCLNANHDMYSGGYGYFDHLLADARFAGHRDSSWFVLENEHWRFVGLDTAWDEEGLHDKRKDRGLQDPQADVVNGYAADEPSLVLLSHHPLFSAYKPDDAFLRRKLATAIDQDKVRAWFWGHEHRAVAYEGHDHVAFGRCVGSGGVPVWKQTYDHPATSPSILWREQRFHDLLIEDFTYFGFAVVDLEGPSMTVTYYDEENSPSYAETISA